MDVIFPSHPSSSFHTAWTFFPASVRAEPQRLAYHNVVVVDGDETVDLSGVGAYESESGGRLSYDWINGPGPSVTKSRNRYVNDPPGYSRTPQVVADAHYAVISDAGGSA